MFPLIIWGYHSIGQTHYCSLRESSMKIDGSKGLLPLCGNQGPAMVSHWELRALVTSVGIWINPYKPDICFNDLGEENKRYTAEEARS